MIIRRINNGKPLNKCFFDNYQLKCYCAGLLSSGCNTYAILKSAYTSSKEVFYSILLFSPLLFVISIFFMDGFISVNNDDCERNEFP